MTIEPRSVQRPVPIWVTSNPARHLSQNRRNGLSRVARLGDGWMTTFQPPDVVREYRAEIQGYAEEAGRELGDDFETCVYYNINVNEDRTRRWPNRSATSTPTTRRTTPSRC